MFGNISMRDHAACRFAQYRRKSEAPRQAKTGRGTDILDSILLLFAVCALLLPTTVGYALATAAAQSLIGLPFAVLMFVSPFALMALLPLRLIHLALDGLFGIRLRISLLAPLSLVCLAMFLMLGPLNIRPALTATAIAPVSSMPSLS
ncbi:hypothetical protein [Pseudooceanicola sp.]|uniref:hypothetical protein n=1 Tax=Pseudooceanicola sp. TaxID=1914328 RepID=UPI00261761CA|nr:hypothetical protein [Pseudooceanicola sp.]MDF1856712.1 hypothetical protein [Pseudooceanicola sp.]